jgi:hypothetical protein
MRDEHAPLAVVDRHGETTVHLPRGGIALQHYPAIGRSRGGLDRDTGRLAPAVEKMESFLTGIRRKLSLRGCPSHRHDEEDAP